MQKKKVVNSNMKDKLFLIRDITYLLIAGAWIAAFFLYRQTALDFMPLLIVVLFVNVDSRIGQIINRLNNKEVAK
jgi:hypothetical protein